jgi:hypothetical protein
VTRLSGPAIDVVNGGEEVPMHTYPLDSYALRLYLGRRLARLHRAWSALAHAFRRARAAMRRFNDQQRRFAARRMSVDRLITQPDSAPENYSEFLFRTSGPLLHEPSATARLSGRGVR